MNGLSLGAGAGQNTGPAVIFHRRWMGLAFIWTAAIIDDSGRWSLGLIQDVFDPQAALQQEPGFLSGLVPGDAHWNGFAGPFIRSR